jgi:GT2 family glycosyltransferase/glycosyltransferase involved in cell wall biosynthesis
VTNKTTEAKYQERVGDWLEGFSRDTPVVVVPVFNAYDDVVECVDSLLASTSTNTPILILDDASTDHRIPDTLDPLSRDRGFAYVRKPTNSGFVGTVNLAFEWCKPHDVVVVNSDVIVPPGWLERLREAAYCRSTNATATPLTNNGTILSVPYRNKPVPDLIKGMTTAEMDVRIREASLMLRPIIPVAIGHCIYFKRSALDAVGYFDEVFAPGYAEEVDFSQRAVMAGFSHVAADDLFVFHKGSRSFDAEGEERRRLLQSSHEKIVQARYPWYHPWVNEVKSDAHGSLALALESARSALLGYRIAIDATRVGGSTTGTQVLILELVRALATAPGRKAHLTMIVGDRTPRAALLGTDQLVDEVIRRSDLQDLEQPLFDLVHRPCQIRSTAQLAFLRKAARRFIVSQLDCIAYSNPGYARSFGEWMDYRHVTQLLFATADGIVFISNDAAHDAAHQGLQIPAERSCVSYLGVDHRQHSAKAMPLLGSDKFRNEPYILVLGTNFRHKNRVYAVRLLRELATEYQWPGHLVFAGPKVGGGSSVAEEERELEHSPELRPHVHDVGPVDEEQKSWLLQNASLVLYPSVYEGFGLIPFEAAATGTPALATRATSLGEVLGDGVKHLDSLDPVAGAEIAWPLLTDPEAAQTQVKAIMARARIFTWRQVADTTWDFYYRLLKMPSRFQARAALWSADGKSLFQRPETSSWQERIVRAFQILRTEGLGALWAEIKQFIEWLRA